MSEVTKLPSMETNFSINVQGKETLKYYEGSFTYKRLSLGKRLEASKMQAKLQEELLTLPADTVMYVEMISQLRFGLTSFPKWWQESNYGLDLYDVNVITAIYKEVSSFEEEWETKVYGPKKEEKAEEAAQ